MGSFLRKQVVFVITILALNVLAFGQDFSASMNVAGGSGSYDLTFGMSPEATNGYDDGIDLYAPPAPPPPAFDAAIGWGGDRYYTQIVNTTSETVEYDIQLQYSDDNTINISWDNTGWSALGNFVLQDAFGGLLGIDVDMTAESSLTLTNPAFTSLKLFVTGFPPLTGPTADFSGDPLEGFEPLTVNFTNASTAGDASITSYAWEFGDGGTSTDENPSYTYSTAGNYTVSLTAVDGNGLTDTEVKEAYVVVNEPVVLTADFSADPTFGVAPLTVQFTDLSYATTGYELTSWAWDFGDGGSSSDQNPSHEYAVNGTYTVSLTVTDATGSDTKTAENFITVSDVPIGDPNLDLVLNIANTEFGYDLGFGFSPDATDGYDEGLDQYAPPPPPPPSFDAALVWNGDRYFKQILNGSVDDLTEHVYQIAVQYGSDNTAILTWDNTDWDILGSFRLTDAFDGALGIDVDMTATSSYTITNPAYTTLKLWVTPSGISTPSADFAADVTTGFPGLNVQFTDTSVPGSGDIAAWAWDFGDGTTSTEQNPLHVYDAEGEYTVSLTITDVVGLTATETKESYITVNPFEGVTADFSADVTAGPPPLSVNFTDLSVTDLGFDVVSWAWDFGDGATSTEQNPSHMFDVEGQYTISLTVVDENGFTDTLVRNNYINAVIEPLYAPLNLTAEVSSQVDVSLTWDEPIDPNNAWLNYDNGENEDGIGLQSGGSFLVSARWETYQLTPYDGMFIDVVRFFPRSETASFNLKIWAGANAGTLVYEQEVTEYVPEIWNDIALTTPIELDASQELWIGYETTHEAGDYPAGCDSGPAEAGFGDLISLDGVEWESMATAYGLNYNWNIQAHLAPTARGNDVVHMPNDLFTGPTVLTNVKHDGPFERGDLPTLENTRSIHNRDFLYYKVYRNGEWIGNAYTESYEDNGLANGDYDYYVTAFYDGGESDPTNTASVNIYFDPNFQVLEVVIFTDDYPGETTWELIDATGSVVASDEGTITDAGTLYEWEVQVFVGDYTWTIFDAWGDGICCAYGEGYYELYLNGELIGTGGEFGDSESVNFIVESLITGTVSGTISDNAGNPVGQAELVVNDEVYTTSTASGAYSFDIFPATYDVTARKYGYVSETALDVEVTQDLTTTVDFTLTPAGVGVLTGTVTDFDTAVPIAGVLMTVQGTPLSTTTDGSGVYQFDEVYVGTYNVTATIDDYSVVTQTVTITENETSTLDFQLSELSEETVTFTMEVDSWASEASWNIYSYETGELYFASDQTFSESGEIQVVDAELLPGDYAVYCHDTWGDGGIAGLVTESGIELTSWDFNDYTTEGVFDFTVVALDYGTLSGTVTELSSGNGVSGALVTAGYSSATSGADGTYSMQVLVGTYDVVCEKDGYNIVTTPGVVIVMNEITTVDYALTSPTLEVAPSLIDVVVEPNDIHTELLTVSNNGDGLLGWSGSISTQDRANLSTVYPLVEDVIDRTSLQPPRRNNSAGLAPVPPLNNPVNLDRIVLDRDTEAYAYNAYDPTGSVPAGPFSFMLENPGNVTPFGFEATDFVATAEWANDTYYGILYGGTFVTLDVETGDYSTIGTTADATGMAYDWTTETMYAVNFDGSLCTIDLETGSYTNIATTQSNMIALACSNEGILYGFDLDSDEVGTIDKETGEWASLGYVGFDFSYAQDASFDHATNTLYWAAYDVALGGELCVVDTETGNVSIIGAFPGGLEATGFAVPGRPDTWVSIDPNSGSVEVGANESVSVIFDATDIIPGTILNGDITFSSDPDVGQVVVPVTMTVGSLEFGSVSGIVSLEDTPYSTGNIEEVLVAIGPYTTTPNGDGTYSFPVYPGTYEAVASLYGYEDAAIGTIVVEEGLETSGVNFDLNCLMAGLSGTTIENITGLTISGVTVTLVESELTYVTDGTGYFEFLGLVEGTYTLVAEADLYEDAFGTVNVSQDVMNVHDLSMQEITAPPSGLLAEVQNYNDVHLIWNSPSAGGDIGCGDILVNELPFTDANTNVGMGDEWPVSGSQGADVAYTLNVTDASMMITVNLCSELTDYDTKLEIFTNNEDCTSPITTEYYNDDGPWGTCPESPAPYTPSLLENVTLTEGQYYIVVDGFSGAEGNYEITITEVTATTALQSETPSFDSYWAEEVDKMTQLGMSAEEIAAITERELERQNHMTSQRDLPTREFLGYNVYRNEALVAESISDTTYVDENVPNGTHLYGVKSVYSTGLSEAATVEVVVDAPLIADFSADVTDGFSPLTVNFTDESQTFGNPVIAWYWEFGDGETSNEQNPTHIYEVMGTYTVTLMVLDLGGASSTEVKEDFINVAHEPGPCEFMKSINVAGGGIDYDLFFGFAAYATDGYDAGVDQYAPPPPPPPSFDAALGWNGDRYFTQILAVACDEYREYLIHLQYPSDNLITLTWDMASLSGYGIFQITDMFDGALGVDVDMTQESSLILTNPAYTTLKLKITPVDNAIDDAFIPEEFALRQNYPNPFNPVTSIQYDLPVAGEVRLDVYNILGEQVATLVQGHHEVGRYTIQWEASNIASGMYFYRISSPKYTSTKKMVLMK